MRLHSEETTLLSTSKKESKAKIEVSAKAFDILSDGLYEHKIAAIIRELSCNAYDSHVEAGCEDIPFKVVLPSKIHKYFEVEDYGVGLDDYEVREVYTTLFASTKTDTDEMIGAFGLGSKTPMSYCETYTITARKDGVERIYTAYKDQTGHPCINLMGQNETDETNGVRVTVPVMTQDIDEFVNEARFILSVFPVRPTVKLNGFYFAMSNTFNKLSKIDRGVVTSDEIYYQSNLYGGVCWFIVMGNVCYRISPSTISEAIDNTNLPDGLADDEVQFLNNFNPHQTNTIFFFKTPIGSVEVNASRENLSLTKRSRLVVYELIRSMLLERRNGVKKEIEEIKSPIARAIKCHQYNNIVAMRYVDKKSRDILHFKHILSKHIYLMWNYSGPYSVLNSPDKQKILTGLSTLLNSKQINIVYTRKKRLPSGMVSYFKDSATNGTNLALKDVNDENSLRRYFTILGIENKLDNIVDFDEIYEQRKQERKLKVKKNREQRVPLDSTEIKGKAVFIDLSKVEEKDNILTNYRCHEVSGKIDLNKYDDFELFLVTKDNYDYIKFVFIEQNYRLNICDICRLLYKSNHKKILFIKETNLSKKKALSAGSKGTKKLYKDIYRQKKIQNKKDIFEIVGLQYGTAIGFMHSLSSLVNHQSVKPILLSNSDATGYDETRSIEITNKNREARDSNRFGEFLSILKGADATNDISNLITLLNNHTFVVNFDDLKNEICRRYPILRFPLSSRTMQYDWKNETQSFIDYIDMINYSNQTKQ